MTKKNNKTKDQPIVLGKKNRSKWYDYNSKIKLLIKPFPFSAMSSGELYPLMKEQFLYCIEDWEGINDDEGNKIPVDGDSKLELYDYYKPIREFIMLRIWKAEGPDPDEVKN